MQGISIRPARRAEQTRLEALQKLGIDLQLSGHTHQGQLWPFNFIVKRIFQTPYGRFSAGDLSGWTDKVFKGKTDYTLVTDNGNDMWY